MNIRIKADKASHLDKICKEMKMNPSQLMEYFLDTIQHLYFDYERSEVKKYSFREILTNLFSHSFRSKLLSLDIVKNLIESTNELLGIKEYVDATIYNMNLDLYQRRISYWVAYESCVGAANMYVYRGLLIEVEINQDYIEVSHVVYEPMFESKEITDKRIDYTSNLAQEFFRGIYHDEFAPFANIEVKILPIRVNPYNLSEPIQSIGIKLIIKADTAENIPSIEKIGPIAERVHFIVMEELNLNK